MKMSRVMDNEIRYLGCDDFKIIIFEISDLMKTADRQRGPK